MDFKEWIMNEMQSFTFPETVRLGVYVGDGEGPLSTKFFNLNGIDMRFEDWVIERGGQKPPMAHFSAPVLDANGQPAFLNFTFASVKQKAMIEPQARFPEIRQDWARFAEFYNGNSVVKPAQYDVNQRYGLATG